jgi:hypothetical protein
VKCIHLNTQISSAALLQIMSHEKLVAESFVRKNPASTLPWKRTVYRPLETSRTTGRHRDKPEKQDRYLRHRRLCVFVNKVPRYLRTHVTYFHILNIIICILPMYFSVINCTSYNFNTSETRHKYLGRFEV